MNRVSLSKGYSSSLVYEPSRDSAVIPAFAAAIKRAISVGSPAASHSPFPVRSPLALDLTDPLACIEAVQHSAEHLRSSLSDFSVIGFTAALSSPFEIPPPILYPIPLK